MLHNKYFITFFLFFVTKELIVGGDGTGMESTEEEEQSIPLTLQRDTAAMATFRIPMTKVSSQVPIFHFSNVFCAKIPFINTYIYPSSPSVCVLTAIRWTTASAWTESITIQQKQNHRLWRPCQPRNGSTHAKNLRNQAGPLLSFPTLPKTNQICKCDSIG